MGFFDSHNIVVFLTISILERRHLVRAAGLHEVAKNKKAPVKRLKLSAVRTRLELVTPCVTGMYSNQLN